MDRNVLFLNAIYQDANESFRSLDALLKQTKEDALIAGEMQQQLHDYQAISRRAKTMIGAYAATPEKENAIADAAARASKHIALAVDDSQQRIAELLIKEGTRGVAEMTRTMREFCCCDKPVAELGQQLLDTRQNHVEQLKKYLQ